MELACNFHRERIHLVTSLTLPNLFVTQNWAAVHGPSVRSFLSSLLPRMQRRDTATSEVRNAADVLREHGDFVWKTLFRLGAPSDDREDLFQQVFLVVQKNLATRRTGESLETTWLHGICANVVRSHRRLAYRNREELNSDIESAVATHEEPSSSVDREKILCSILEAMPEPQREVFVMHELEELGTRDIARELAVPLGTVHSRLRLARVVFEKACERFQAQAEYETATPSVAKKARKPFSASEATW